MKPAWMTFLLALTATLLGACGNGNGSGPDGRPSDSNTVMCPGIQEVGNSPQPVGTEVCRANRHVWRCGPTGEWADTWKNC